MKRHGTKIVKNIYFITVKGKTEDSSIHKDSKSAQHIRGWVKVVVFILFVYSVTINLKTNISTLFSLCPHQRHIYNNKWLF